MPVLEFCIIRKLFIAYEYSSVINAYYKLMITSLLFTARCTLVQTAVLRSHVVCLSVCDVGGLDCDHIGWNSSKIILRLVSVGRSLSIHPSIMDLLQGEQPEIWAQSDPPPVDLSVGDILSQIAAELLQIAQRSQWRAYRKPPSLFRMGPSLTPYDLAFPQNGGSICPQYMRMAISPQRVIRYTSCLVLG